ncbi:MAG: rRNA maturation RNase YbeY [Anaerolineaceae bacterium]|nr:rRNA maturation RNase YbeY [Anaerolineaceae bacterium]
MNIQVDEAYENLVDLVHLRRIAQISLEQQAINPRVDMSIVISSDAVLQQLNHEFLGIDAPTDVLSFPSDEIDPSTGERYLGDIIISYPRAESQAHESGHPINAEIELLIVHGVLHLLGYDHATEEERKRMWGIQAIILEHLGNPIKDVPG